MSNTMITPDGILAHTDLLDKRVTRHTPCRLWVL